MSNLDIHGMYPFEHPRFPNKQMLKNSWDVPWLSHIIDKHIISEKGVYKLIQFLAPILETHPVIFKSHSVIAKP